MHLSDISRNSPRGAVDRGAGLDRGSPAITQIGGGLHKGREGLDVIETLDKPQEHMVEGRTELNEPVRLIGLDPGIDARSSLDG